MQLHDASEYLIDRAEYSWSYSGLEYSDTEEPHAGEEYYLYQPAASEPLQYNQTAWEYSAELPHQADHRLSTRFSLTPR